MSFPVKIKQPQSVKLSSIMTIEALKESLIDQVGRTSKDRLLEGNLLSPQNVFVRLENKAKAITYKPDHVRSLYESRKSHSAALRTFYPFYLEDAFRGSKEAKTNTKRLFKSHEVKFNDENYAKVATAVLDHIAGLSDEELSVIKGSEPKWSE
jgi:hypothetical protein